MKSLPQGIRKQLYSHLWPRVALIAGLLSLFALAALGLFSYRKTRIQMEASYLSMYGRIVRDMAFEAGPERSRGRSDDFKIAAIVDEWRHIVDAREGEYMFIVDREGRFLYHSEDPGLAGHPMPGVRFRSIDGKVSIPAGELIASRLDFAGYGINGDGSEFMTIMQPVDIGGGYLGIYREREDFIGEAIENDIIAVWVIVPIFGAVLILCLIVLFVAYRSRRELLRLSEERYRRVVNDQTEAILRWTPDGMIVFANESSRNLPGMVRDELVGKSVFTLVEAGHAAVLRSMAVSMSPESPIRVNEHRSVRAGIECWEQWINRGFFDERGGLVEIQSVGRDITDRKRTEDALKESESKFRFLAENTGGLSFILNLDLSNQYITPNAEQILGFRPAERKHRSVMERLTDESCREVEEAFAREMEKARSGDYDPGSTTRLELQYRHKDGSIRIIDTAVRFLWNRTGVIEGIYGVGRDVTEQKKAEALREAAQESLRESEARYRFLVENMGDVAFVVGIDFKTQYVTPSIERVLGFTPEERRAQSPGQQLTPRSYRYAQERFAMELKKNQEGADPARTVTMELEYYHKNGTIRTLETVFKGILDERGDTMALYGIARDITDRKETEAWLKSSLEEKDILLKEIHHRVKNNMQIISSLLDLQKTMVSDPQAYDLFGTCQSRIKAMAMVHERLYQSGNFSSINLRDLLYDIVQEHSFVILTGAAVDIAVEAEDLFVSIATAIPCALLVNELVSNALKHAFHGREKGSIVVGLQQAGEETCQLTVQDDGTGLPEAEPTERTDRLGLQMVDGLVRQIGGSIRFSSGDGTTVSVTFPM
ncbi:MAG: PAS domain S-box protein [Spirochaetes bacterium]|nr:PAS domain S-box protein [Spirochaetota bacterium]